MQALHLFRTLGEDPTPTPGGPEAPTPPDGGGDGGDADE